MDNKQRMNYAGAIGLLCECSVKLGNGCVRLRGEMNCVIGSALR